MRPFTIKPHAAALARALSALGLVCASAAQADVVTFDTEVIQVACTPDLNNSGAPSAVITLPEIKVSALGKNVGDTAGETEFTIGLNSCGDKVPAGTVAGAYFYGAPFPYIGNTWRATSNMVNGAWFGRLIGSSSDGGNGWHYQLLKESGNEQISVLTSASTPSSATLDNLPSVDVSSGSGTLRYRVRYYRVHTYTTYWNSGTVNHADTSPAQVNPGTRTAEATYVIYYR